MMNLVITLISTITLDKHKLIQLFLNKTVLIISAKSTEKLTPLGRCSKNELSNIILIIRIPQTHVNTSYR